MVGIPGRSKGCHTCRRRKVKCDEGKPTCKRCAKAGIECDGYLKHPVFLNRTVTGLQKRKPLEEAVTRNQALQVQALNGSSQPTIPEIGLTAVWKQRIEEFFLERFLAEDHTSNRPSPGNYVFESITSIHRDNLLESAIEALCLTRVGRINNDSRLVKRGMRSYSLALQWLNHAVSVQKTLVKDSTCAAAKIMNLYEFYEPSFRCGKAVIDHTLGIERLLQYKTRTEDHQTRAMSALVTASRYNSMIISIKGITIDSPLAAYKPPDTESKGTESFEHSLYDIGFHVAMLIHDMLQWQNIQQPSGPVLDPKNLEDLLQRCTKIQQSLQSWYEEFFTWCGSPVYWIDSDFEVDLRTDVPVLKFSHTLYAHILIDYWALQIIFGRVLVRLSVVLESYRSSDGVFDNEILAIFNELLAQNCNTTQILYALKILASVNYCNRKESGMAGMDKMFGLEVSLRLFRMLSGSYSKALEEKTVNILKALAADGLRFAEIFIQNSPCEVWERLHFCA